MSMPLALALAFAFELVLAWVIPGALTLVPLTVVGVGVRLGDRDPVVARPRVVRFDKDL